MYPSCCRRQHVVTLGSGGLRGCVGQCGASGVHEVIEGYEGEVQTGGLVTAFLGKAIWAGGASPGLLEALQTPQLPFQAASPASAHLLAAGPRSTPSRASCQIPNPHTPDPWPHGSFQKWERGSKTYLQCWSAKDTPRGFFCNPRLCQAPQATFQPPVPALGPGPPPPGSTWRRLMAGTRDMGAAGDPRAGSSGIS